MQKREISARIIFVSEHFIKLIFNKIVARCFSYVKIIIRVKTVFKKCLSYKKLDCNVD